MTVPHVSFQKAKKATLVEHLSENEHNSNQRTNMSKVGTAKKTKTSNTTTSKPTVTSIPPPPPPATKVVVPKIPKPVKVPLCSARYCSITKDNHVRLHNWLWPGITLSLPDVKNCSLCAKLQQLFLVLYHSKPDLLYITSEPSEDDVDDDMHDEYDTNTCFGHNHGIWLIHPDDSNEEVEITLPIAGAKDTPDQWTNKVLNFIKKQFYIKNIVDFEQSAKIKARTQVQKLKQKTEKELEEKKGSDASVPIEIDDEDDEDEDEAMVDDTTTLGKKKSSSTTAKSAPIISILAGMNTNKLIDEWKPHAYQQQLLVQTLAVYLSILLKKAPYSMLFPFWKQGSGKTGILYVFQQLTPSMPNIHIVCDKGIIDQWVTGDCGILTRFPAINGSTTYNIYGYDRFRALVRENPDLIAHDFVVIDECQEYRTLQPTMLDDMEAYLTAMIRFPLTGTPFMAGPSDLFYLNILNAMSPVRDLASIEALAEEFYHPTMDSKKRRFHEINTSNPKQRKLKHLLEIEDEYAAEDETDIPREFHYTLQFDNPDYIKWIYESYQGKVFFYEPEAPVKVKYIDVKVPMTYMQTLHYIMQHDSKPVIGNFHFTTAVRNSYGSVSRRVGNCILDEETKEVLVSPKFDAINDMIEKQLHKPVEGESFPWVIASRYLNRGVLGQHKTMLQRALKWKKKPRVGIITGKVKDRETIRQSCLRGDTDLLYLGPVGNRGLDLPNFSRIILIEIDDTPGLSNYKLYQKFLTLLFFSPWFYLLTFFSTYFLFKKNR
jgi:hypothetical protein